ncbi:hypothetical protein IAT40_006137 [Kwoniella sp. CBS 6097]
MSSMTYEYHSDEPDEPPEPDGSHDGDEHRQHQYSSLSDEDNIESRHSASGVNDLAEGEYFVEAERTYNNATWVYRLPADQEEVIRQDRQHYIMLGSLPGLYRGPVEEILNDRSRHRRMLDIGCGTGIWLQEMAELFPHVDCIGIDLMPLQHDHQMRNCTFMRVFAPTGLKIFGDDSFDVIHLRQMLQGTNEYPAILVEVYRMLRPGGIFLIHEPQIQIHSAWEGLSHTDLAPCLSKASRGERQLTGLSEQLVDLLRGAMAFRGISPDLFSGMESALIDAGFEPDSIDTYYHYRQLCADDPSSEDGQNQAINTVSYFHAARLMILESGLTDEDTFDELLAGISDEVCGRSRGRAGPLGGQGILSPWGYWWAIKRG